MSRPTDVAVIGGGIVGLATAWRLLEADASLRVAVLEKEPRVGVHQSSHNSGVLHAGVYYEPGSAKADLCRRGKAELEEFCDQHDVPYRLNGKLIVAVDEQEVPGLDRLEQRARRNGVPGLRRLDAVGIREVEPHVRGVAALESPRTGVVDFAAVCLALERVVREAGGEVRTGTEVRSVTDDGSRVRLSTTQGEFEARVAVACAGLQADRLAARAGLTLEVRIVPFRGSWLEVGPEARHLVSGNVYPVPEPGLPFLGVHATRRIDGSLWLGPNAVLAFDREGYDRPAVSPADLGATLRWPGFLRLARAHWRTAVDEVAEDAFPSRYVRRVQRYIPALTPDAIHRGPSGIRAQAVSRDGRLVDDFVFAQQRRTLHVVNAPSPAATASLAIGAVLRDRILDRLR